MWWKKTSKKIKLESFKKLWKTKKALECVDEELIWVVKEYRTKTHKPQWSVTWKDIADRVFSEYVRLTHVNKDWMCKCVTCWAVLPRTEMQNWHYITRWNMKYRFDTTNCNCQCYRCNCVLSWNYQRYTLYMIDVYWMQKVQSMLDDKTTKEFKQYEYEEMIVSWYREIQLIKTTLSQNSKKTWH